MRFNRLVLIILFSMLATVAFVDGGQVPKFLGPSTKPVPMPNYSKWDKTNDHSSSYLSGGKEIQVRDEHYQHVNPEKTEGAVLVMFYNPSTTKPWFAVYSQRYADPQKPGKAYLYDYDANESWVFIQEIPDEDTMLSLLKSRYDLIQLEK